MQMSVKIFGTNKKIKKTALCYPDTAKKNYTGVPPMLL